MYRNSFIPSPSSPRIVSQGENTTVFEIEPLYPGYGVTIGNALRRVLLSSLEGAAVTTVRFENVPHEFTTIPGVKETVLDIILNVKQLRLRLYGDEPQTVKLHKKGEGMIAGKDLKTPTQVEVISKDIPIAILTDKKAELNAELIVERGVGYMPTANREGASEKLPVGTVAIDALFSPVREVNFEVENMRFRDRTDYNRLRLSITTDGSLTPSEALAKAAELLMQQFSAFAGAASDAAGAAIAVKKEKPKASARPSRKATALPPAFGGNVLKQPIAVLGLPGRVGSHLKAAGIQTVSGILRRRTSELAKLPGISDRSIAEIRNALAAHGLKTKE